MHMLYAHNSLEAKAGTRRTQGRRGVKFRSCKIGVKCRRVQHFTPVYLLQIDLIYSLSTGGKVSGGKM